MSKLDQVESLIIDELYLIISFDQLKESANFKPGQLETGLIGLIKSEYVDQFKYSNVQKDFVQQRPHDFENLMEYHYLATKEGMFAHNTL